MKYLWLDDERAVPAYFNNGEAEIARSYDEAIDIFLDMNDGEEFCIGFDHDLGKGKTGYDFAEWLVEHGVTGNFEVHTMNGVGRFNIIQLLTHYGWTQMFKNQFAFFKNF